MTNIRLDIDSELSNYILFALKTRIQKDITSEWGSNTTLDYDVISDDQRVDIYLIVSGVRQTPSDKSTKILSELIDRHYSNVNSDDKLTCVVYDSTNGRYPHQWIVDVLDVIDFNPGVNYWIKGGIVTAQLDRVVDFNASFNTMNESLSIEISKLWREGIVKISSGLSQDIIARWDLTHSYRDAYIPDWIEPRLSANVSEILIKAIEAYPDKTVLTFQIPKVKSLVTRHHISSWCKDFLGELSLFTQDNVTIALLNVEEFHSFVNFVYLDEPSLSGSITTSSSHVNASNSVGETTYLTSEGYVKSINLQYN